MFIIAHAGFVVTFPNELSNEDVLSLVTMFSYLDGVSAATYRAVDRAFVIALKKGAPSLGRWLETVLKRFGEPTIRWIETGWVHSGKHTELVLDEVAKLLAPTPWHAEMTAEAWLAEERARAPFREAFEKLDKYAEDGAVYD